MQLLYHANDSPLKFRTYDFSTVPRYLHSVTCKERRAISLRLNFMGKKGMSETSFLTPPDRTE
jgi:hypothetical protein